MFTCNVSADLFRRALSCVSTEETRYYLTGVFVEPCASGGALLVATDGHKLVAIRDPSGEVSGSAIVSPDKASAAALKAKGFDRRLVVSGDALQLSVVEIITDRAPRTAHLQAEPCIIDGSFPDWRRVVPETVTPAAGHTVDVTHLGVVARALQTPGLLRSSADHYFVRMYSESAVEPIVVYGGLPDAFGVVMPARPNGLGSQPGKPDWATMPSELAVEEAAA